jgi:hypothetical protein
MSNSRARGVVAILALFLGEKFLLGRPVALGVVLAALVVASVGQVDQHGVKVVGQLPAGLPHFKVVGESLGTVQLAASLWQGQGAGGRQRAKPRIPFR